MNIYSRKNEFEADNFARVTFSAEALASALKKLSSDSLSNLYSASHVCFLFITRIRHC